MKTYRVKREMPDIAVGIGTEGQDIGGVFTIDLSSGRKIRYPNISHLITNGWIELVKLEKLPELLLNPPEDKADEFFRSLESMDHKTILTYIAENRELLNQCFEEIQELKEAVNTLKEGKK